MVEYHDKKSSGVSKAALATGIGAAVVALGGGLPILGGVAPVNRAAAFAADPTGGFVTDKEMCLIRENTADKSTIAQLTAEKYADNALRVYAQTEVEPLKTRVCNIETALAVNAARDQDFRRYVNAEFVHQPKATMNEMIVTCKPCGCNHGCDCGHDHGYSGSC